MAKWKGQTVVVIGSGPSLTAEDCALVEKSSLTTIAVNNAWKAARFCHALYAGDLAWWRHYGAEVDIDTEKYTLSQNAAHVFGINRHKSKLGAGYNSGLLAVEMAMAFGAARVLLLGFDCSVANGIHFDGVHQKTPNPDRGRCEKWKEYFSRLADTRPKTQIINCSRYTEIDVFERQPLEVALCEHGLT